MHSSVYLRADEQMQLNPLCLVLMDEHTEKGQAGLLVRIPTLVQKNRTTFISTVAHLPIHFIPKNRAIKKELHFIPEMQLTPMAATKFIHFITKNPQVLRVIEEKIYSLVKKNEVDPIIQEMFTSYKNTMAQDKVSSFTVSTMSEGLYLVEQNGEILQNVGHFTLTDRGGYFHFTTIVATLYDSVAQSISVNCKMYLFLDQEKLGYYFEFFLNQQNLLHQKIYELLPDLLMDNHPFLERALSVLETSTHDQPSVVELIEKFRESL